MCRNGSRTGHWPGMDVHDCGSTPSPAASRGRKKTRLYVRPANGCELMTRGVPAKAEEIEALMRG